METQTAFLDDRIKLARDAFLAKFDGIEEGEVILVSHGATHSLMEFERADTEIETGNTFRLHRTMNIMDSSGIIDTMEKRPPRRRDTDRLKGNIYGVRCLNFEHDSEFDIYWPTAYLPDIFMRLATRYNDGYVALSTDSIEVTRGRNAITQRLSGIVRPFYRSRVIDPFFGKCMTGFEAPRWGFKGWCKLMPGFLLQYSRVANTLNAGDFIYVGCKQEVYLLGVAKEGGDIYMQGTYTASTKPPLYFTNARLDHNDAREGSFVSDAFEHGLLRAVFNPLNWHRRRQARNVFLCPQMGRKQNCKYTVFSGEPELVTGNVKEALEHFATTDFFEYADIVKAYAERIREAHPTLRPCSRAGFYI